MPVEADIRHSEHIYFAAFDIALYVHVFLFVWFDGQSINVGEGKAHSLWWFWGHFVAPGVVVPPWCLNAVQCRLLVGDSWVEGSVSSVSSCYFPASVGCWCCGGSIGWASIAMWCCVGALVLSVLGGEVVAHVT